MRGVFLGLGSNLGDRMEFLQKAILKIDEYIGMVVEKSSIVETKPWGKADQPDFLNMVVEVDTALDPTELLKQCHRIEFELGRSRGEKWGARTIDIDILVYGDLIVDTPSLVIPHKFMRDRDFVMKLLKEIAPKVWRKIKA